METAAEFNKMVDAVLAAHAAIEAHGTPEMQALSRVLLHEVGRELGRRVLAVDVEQ